PHPPPPAPPPPRPPPPPPPPPPTPHIFYQRTKGNRISLCVTGVQTCALPIYTTFQIKPKINIRTTF
ncbi:hypothetical protein, partial [Campylobacter jejuni]|uniref:hypothetical protein n=1 Tax=Campylobacter jejuni TaxID=197 RepID=UPI0022421230